MTKRPKLRTPENAERICAMLAEGRSLRQIGRKLGCDASAIAHWVREDQDAGGSFSQRYARAKSIGIERLADDLVEISDADYRLPDGSVDNAAIQQARLQVDTRKWLLSKLAAKVYGDRIVQEVVGDGGGAVITRIELIGISARRLDPPTVEGDDITIAEAAVPPLRVVPSR